MKSKFAIPFILSGLMVVCAMAFGWQHYKSEPAGDLLYTENGPCPNMANSFATGYFFVLLLCGSGVLMTVLVSFLGAYFAGTPERSLRLKAVAKGGVMMIALLVLAAFFSFSADILFPLQDRPGCGPGLTFPPWQGIRLPHEH